MDEVDGSSRGTSTDGSGSDGFPRIQPELHLSRSESFLQQHSPWPSSQREIAYSSQSRGLDISSRGRTDVDYGHAVASNGVGNQFGSHLATQSRGHNISSNGRTDVNRTDLTYDPAVALNSSEHQFFSHLATMQRETSHPKSVKHNGNENASANYLTNCPAGGGGASNKLPEAKLPSRQHNSRTEEQAEFLFREDEPSSVLSGGLNSGTRQPRLDSRNNHTFELRSDLNPQYDRDREKNVFVPKYEDETSLLSLSDVRQPPSEQIELREHLLKEDPTALRDRTYHNAQTQGTAAYQRSMTGSFVQQCSDVHGYESYVPFEREFYEGFGNSLPREMREGYIGAGHLENVVQNQDALLRARDQELLELKEANHRQSLFIEKVMTEKRLLETAVVEQARLLMSNGPQRSNAAGPVQQTVAGRGGSFDSQLYETQLATYKEDFENERKEKLLIKGSADSLKEQLQTALNELRLAQDKLKKTEEELERYRNPYRAAYEPFLRTSSNHTNMTASSSSSTWSSRSAASAAAAQNKTSLYRKPDQLEQDRVNRTVLRTPTEIGQTSTTGHKTTVVDLSDLTRPGRPCSIENTKFPSLSQLCQVCLKKLNGAAKRPHSQEYVVNQKHLINSGHVSQVEEMNLTGQGQCDLIRNAEQQILRVL